MSLQEGGQKKAEKKNLQLLAQVCFPTPSEVLEGKVLNFGAWFALHHTRQFSLAICVTTLKTVISKSSFLHLLGTHGARQLEAFLSRSTILHPHTPRDAGALHQEWQKAESNGHLCNCGIFLIMASSSLRGHSRPFKGGDSNQNKLAV